MKLTEYLVIAKDMALTLAPFLASGIAWYGLSTWKRQSRGTAAYEVARGTLFTSYQLADRIRTTRSPMLTLSEKKVKANGQLAEEMASYDDRQEKLVADFLIFKTKIQEGRAIWGREILEHYEKIDALVRELRAAIWLHFWMKGAYAGPGAIVDHSSKRVEENNLVVYYTDGTDSFSEKIDSAFKDLEDFLILRMK